MNKEELIKKYLTDLNMTEEFSCLEAGEILIERYKKGDYLFHAGETVDSIYFLAEGRCWISNGSSEGKEIAIDYDIPEGRFIGEMEIAAGIDYFHTVSVARDSVIFRIPLKVVEKKLMNYPPFLRAVCRQLGWELTESGKKRVRVGLYGAKERVAKYLYEIAAVHPETVFTISCRQTALECSVSERHLNRVLHGMVQEGILEKNRNRIRILDLAALQSLMTEV